MPKYGIHHIVLNETIKKLETGSGDAQEAAKLLERESFAATLGSIGPDLFFFASDYDIIGQLNTLMPIVEFLSEVHELYEQAVSPIRRVKDEIGSAIDVTLDTLGLGVITEIQDRIDSIEGLIKQLNKSAIASGLLRGLSPFETATTESGQATSTLARMIRELYENYLIPPLQENYDEPDWYWFDMLHYRNVGDFAKNLLELASTDQQKAYALAYLTHIGTDLVGHPYVNQIVGGPFRLGVQRHVTVENFMDVYEFREQKGLAINQTLAAELKLDAPSTEELPDDIAELLVEAAKKTFEDRAHPMRINGNGFFEPQDAKDAYRLLRVALEFMGGRNDLRPVPPSDTSDQDLAEVMAAINSLNPPPPPPNLVPPIPDFSMESLFAGEITLNHIASALADVGQDFAEWFDNWIGYLEEFLQYCRDTAMQLLLLARSLVELSANVTARPLLAILYGIQLSLYDMIKACRHVLALNGLTYPDADMIDDAVAQSLISISDEDLHYVYSNNGSNKRNRFPMLRVKGQSHLIAPFYYQECKLTVPAFHTPNGAPVTPSSFISEEPFDVDAIRAYVDARSPDEAQGIRDRGQRMGNAVDVCSWMIENAFAQSQSEYVFANWNLDGDRGYGAKSWTALVPHNADLTPIVQLSIAQASDTQLFPTNGMFDPDGTIPVGNPDSNLGFQGRCTNSPDGSDYFYSKIKSKNEHFDLSRVVDEFQIANLTIAENNVPDPFKNFEHRDANRWAEILAPRLLVDSDSWRENCYHVNGVGTPAYDAMYERFNLEHFFKTGNADRIHVKLLYNFTDNSLPFRESGTNRLVDDLQFQSEILSYADAIQALLDKLWSYRVMWNAFGGATLPQLYNRAATDPINFSIPDLPPIENATTIATISLLYEAMRKNRPLGLIGYSHGTQILTNGMLAFGFQGDQERQFLASQVKLFFVGRMVSPGTLPLVRRMVRSFMDITNPNDVIPDLVGNIPPDVPFISSLTPISVNLQNGNVRSAMVDYVQGLSAEQHKLYLYALRVKNDSPNHQDFF